MATFSHLQTLGKENVLFLHPGGSFILLFSNNDSLLLRKTLQIIFEGVCPWTMGFSWGWLRVSCYCPKDLAPWSGVLGIVDTGGLAAAALKIWPLGVEPRDRWHGWAVPRTAVQKVLSGYQQPALIQHTFVECLNHDLCPWWTRFQLYHLSPENLSVLPRLHQLANKKQAHICMLFIQSVHIVV